MSSSRAMKCACLLVGQDFKPGDPAPEGYLAWHEWAETQAKAGLKQQTCGYCGKWKFPQELSGEILRSPAMRIGKGGIERMEMESPICLKCAAKRAEKVSVPGTPEDGDG